MATFRLSQNLGCITRDRPTLLPALEDERRRLRARRLVSRSMAPLARIMHAWSAAGPLSSVLTAFPTLGLLGRVDDYACAALGRKVLSARRFRPFASTTRELCGLTRSAPILGWARSEVLLSLKPTSAEAGVLK